MRDNFKTGFTVSRSYVEYVKGNICIASGQKRIKHNFL
jgi:hypothetical protein